MLDLTRKSGGAVLFFACTLIGACAQGGGGGTDSGGIMLFDAGRRDSGTPGMDAGMGTDGGPVDSGAPGTDSGPPGIDSGPPPIDAGRDAGMDAGMDAGPPPFDAGPPMCSESPCRLVSPQCGCGAGEACYPTASGRACATAGTGGEGSACTSNSSCAAGMACASGVCSRLCITDVDCPGRGSYCVFSLGSAARVCSVPCEPANGTGCPSGYACRWYAGGPAGYYTDCEPEGTVPLDGLCSSSSDCQADLRCVNFFGESSCTAVCRLGGGDCPICFSFFDGTPSVDGDDYGWCG